MKKGFNHRWTQIYTDQSLPSAAVIAKFATTDTNVTACRAEVLTKAGFESAVAGARPEGPSQNFFERLAKFVRIRYGCSY
jgi:hypothetical protein